MEKEELYSKITTSLGSTQLSEKTISDFIDDVYEDVKSADSVNDDFIARKVNYLKSMNGQLHADVSAQVNEYKKKNPYTKPVEEPKPSEDEPDWFKAYREAQERRISAMETSQKAEIEEKAKAEILGSVKKSLKAKFKEAGIDVNDYFLRQSMSEVSVPPLKDEKGNKVEVDVEALTKKAENGYYKHLKEAGFEMPQPRRGGAGGGAGGKTEADAFFARKAKKEGWGKK